METVTASAREGGGGERRAIEAAQLAFGGSVLDCALLDASRGGARVFLLALAAVPEYAILRLRGGESWTVRRQWQQGAQVGFRVVGTASPPPDGLPAAAAPAGWW